MGAAPVIAHSISGTSLRTPNTCLNKSVGIRSRYRTEALPIPGFPRQATPKRTSSAVWKTVPRKSRVSIAACPGGALQPGKSGQWQNTASPPEQHCPVSPCGRLKQSTGQALGLNVHTSRAQDVSLAAAPARSSRLQRPDPLGPAPPSGGAGPKAAKGGGASRAPAGAGELRGYGPTSGTKYRLSIALQLV